ncbi:MAG: diguanylate cyclase, partial [Anaerolineaceae bacterium]
ALNVPQAGIALLNDDKTELTVMATKDMNNSAPATGYTIPLENNEASQRVVREGKPVIVTNAQTDPSNESVHDLMQQRKTVSMLIAPILIHGQVIGTLGLDMDVFHEFTQREIDLAQSCAQVIGQALENARLYQKVKQELAERRTMADALRESEERYRTLVENQGEGVAILDLELRFTFTNPAAESIFGVPPGGLIGKPLTNFIHPDQKERLMDEIADSATGGKFIFEADIQTAGGSERNLILTANVRRGTDDAVSGIFAVFRDNTDRKQAEIKLRFLSTHDTLTELFNRTYFEEEMVRLAMSRQFPISLIVVDVDGLKHVNDNYGHPRGDELLRRTAGVLRASFRLEDLVARIGGDEFGILLPNADAIAAARGIERVRKFLASHNATNQGLQISLSLGAATAEMHESLTETYKRADQAMYMDKISRRGRTIVDAFH